LWNGGEEMKRSVLELAYRYVYPSVRRSLVEIMYRDMGLSQNRIARIMHIDQSTVSRYLEGERGGFINLAKYREVYDKIYKYALKIVDEGPDEYMLSYYLTRLTLWIMGRGYICGYHRELDETIDVSRCDICMRLFGNIELDDESHGREQGR
jgi:predicted transcriptional regulator